MLKIYGHYYIPGYISEAILINIHTCLRRPNNPLARIGARRINFSLFSFTYLFGCDHKSKKTVGNNLYPVVTVLYLVYIASSGVVLTGETPPYTHETHFFSVRCVCI